MNLHNQINYSIAFVFIKYINLFLGFLRTSIVAITLTKYQMGSLAIVYLIVEYFSYLFNLGVPNAINLRISVLKKRKDMSLNNNIVLSYYTHFFYSLLFVSIIILIIFNFFLNFLNNSEYFFFIKNINLIFLAMFLYALREFFIIHNRVWGNFKKILLADIVYQLFLLLGIYFFLNSDQQDPIRVIMLITIVASIFHLIISIDNISLNWVTSFSYKNSKKILIIGFFLMCQNLLDFFFWGIDRFFISIFLERSELAEFHVVNTYARGLMLFFPTFVFLIYPSILSELSDKKRNNSIKEKLLKYHSFSESLLFVIFALYILLVPYLITLILPEYKKTYYIFAIILIGLIIKSLSFFYIALIVSRQKQKILVFISIIFVIITVLGYKFLNLNKIVSKEYFCFVSVFVFLIYSICLTFLSCKLLKLSTKDALKLVFKKYYRLVSLYVLLFYFFKVDLNPLHASFFIITFIIFSNYKNIQINITFIFNFFKKKLINFI